VMLTHKLYDLDLKSGVTQFLPGAILAAGLLIILVKMAVTTKWAGGPGRPPAVTTADIGALFMGRYLLPFEAASILLLVALIGAAMIVRRKTNA
jgi:NADH:ubiquinone oxidoreductase subunit 6 (subunit J)